MHPRTGSAMFFKRHRDPTKRRRTAAFRALPKCIVSVSSVKNLRVYFISKLYFYSRLS